MISFENAIKFPFAQKDWQSTVGIYFLITFAVGTLTAILQFVFQLPADVLSSIAQESSEVGVEVMAESLNLIYVVISTAVAIIVFPVTLYLSGYIFDTVRHILYSKEPSIPAHGQIWFRLKLGSVRLLITLILSLISLILAIIPGIVLVAGFLTLEASALGTIFIIFGGLLGILWLLISTVGMKFAQYAMEYQYLKNGFRSIFHISAVYSIIANNLKNLLILFVFEMVGGFLVALAFISCCLVFIVQPALATMVAFTMAYYYGMTYKSLIVENRV